MNLYELTNDLLEVEHILTSEADGEEANIEEIERIKEIILANLQNKAENIAYYIRNTEAMIEARKNEEKRIKETRQKLEKSLDKFKSYVVSNLVELDRKKVETSIGNISVRKSKAVEVSIAPEELDDRFKRVKTICEADKKAIKEALNNGEEVKGAEIVENLSLSIR